MRSARNSGRSGRQDRVADPEHVARGRPGAEDEHRRQPSAITAAAANPAEELSSTGTPGSCAPAAAKNPTLKTLAALATFFNVPFGYFGEDHDAELASDEAALLTLLKDKGISGTALRSLAGLSPESRQMITEKH